MAWIPLNQSVFTHRKTMVLAEALDIPEVYAVGHLAALWSWCMDNAPEGELSEVTPRIIARASQWPGIAADFLAALLSAGYLQESDRGYTIPNWMEYGGKVIEQREKDADRKRQARSQDPQKASGGCPTDVRRMSAVEKKRVEESRREEIETPPTEEEDAREALRPTADTQAGAIFPPDRPLPLLVQDFIQAKAGADAPRWEAELRLKLECKPLTGSPDSYMLGVLRGWVRDGGPPQPTPQRAQGGPRLTAAEERDARLKAERDADFEQMAEVERRLFADPWAVQEPEPPSLPAGRVRVSDAAFVRPTAPQGRRTTGGLLQ